MKAIAHPVIVALVATLAFSTIAQAAPNAFSAWSPAHNVELLPGADPAFNTADLEGCPFIAPDDKTFFMASNRPGGFGGLDIWVATRASADAPWGGPVNAGPQVNSAANDFCPTMTRDGQLFYFVSDRPGGCGMSDIYVTQLRSYASRPWPRRWPAPRNLGCQVNSAANEFSPFPLHEAGRGTLLYFSSNRVGGFSDEAPNIDHDIYLSASDGGVFGPAELVQGVNTSYDDAQPNLRRDGLELFFYSTRPGTLGLADIYAATRVNTADPWSGPVNLGPNVNSADGAETRPSLSWDGTVLYFGSTRPGGDGSSDIYVTTRERLTRRTD